VIDSSPDTTPEQAFVSRAKFASLVWPLLLTMTAMLLLSIASISMLSSLRAYVNGEGLWSKSERQAVAELHRYATTGREEDYQRFRDELGVPLGDRLARTQLQSAKPDLELAARGFLAGRNDPADVPGMIRLFRGFGTSHIMAEPLRLWTAGDGLIVQLGRVGEQLHQELASSSPRALAVDSLAVAADEVHARVAPLEDQFSRSLGLLSREVATLLLVVVSVGSGAMASLGAVVFRMHLQRNERIAAAMRAGSERLQHLATHDSLTGLHNRLEFEARLGLAIDTQRHCGKQFALLYLDLDQFKVINDTCGHAAGDDLIRKVAWLVQGRLRETDTLARLGGDEFGVLLHGSPPDAALALAEGIRAAIAELRFDWDGRSFPVTASIGLLNMEVSVASVDDALSAADQACYLAKDSGRNRVQVYRPDDQQVQVRHGEMRWVERLNTALDHDQFVLLAQEIRALEARPSRRESGVARLEVLLRMVAPDGSWIAPMAFIPAAERYGLMPRLDRWVIARACRELAELRSTGKSLPVCMINLSGASVSDPSLADYIATCLQHHGLRGTQVGFELTETAAIGNLASASLLMRQLRKLGAAIALDDFGSGMSSFSYLKALPIDLLKIDGAFVRDINSDPVDRAVVEAIQRIGRVMGIKTVAECVEHEAAVKTLARIGVDYVQGFHIGRPGLLAQVLRGDVSLQAHATTLAGTGG
jgi:diguanylate cyclase (GGDEF)-like protein